MTVKDIGSPGSGIAAGLILAAGLGGNYGTPSP